MSKEEGYIVSALKYRPAEWDEVVGQSAVSSTLKNAIEREEIAKAYLFCGPRGVGKTTSARIFAKAINSKYIPEGTDLSFNVFELDAASNNSVDDIRQLIDQVRIQPQLGKYKVYIIDEVHMLSTQAFNAFLKTLEEPPPHAIFILATTEKHKVLPTILSRCQIYDFQRIGVLDMVTHLAHIAKDQSVTFEEEALHLIATKADGALRDALSLFDQMVSFTGKNLTYAQVASNLNVLDHEYFGRIVTAIAKGDVGTTLLTYDEVLKKGFDSLLFMIGLAEHLRDMLIAKDPQTIHLLDAPDSVKQAYLDQSQLLDMKSIVAHLDILNKAEVTYRPAKNKRLLTEITLMKLCAQQGIVDNSVNEKKKPLSEAKPEETKTPSAINAPSDSAPKSHPLAESIKATESEAQTPPQPANSEASSSTAEATPADQPTSTRQEDPEENPTPIHAVSEPAPVIPMPASNPDPSPETPEPMRAKVAPSSEELILNAVKVTPQENQTQTATPQRKTKRRKGISLSELDEEDEEIEKDTSTADEPEHVEGKTIDKAALMTAWKAYAEKIHAAQKYSFHSTLINREPQIVDDHTIKLYLENNVQMEHLNVEKADLMEHIRAALDHPGIRLESEIVEDEQENIAFKTSRDRLMDMVKQNPTLQKMYEDFDLDID